MKQNHSDVEKFYDKLSTTYNEKRLKTNYQKYIHNLELKFVLNNVSKGKVLEIGPGTGRFTSALADHCKQVLVIDISSKMLEKVKHDLKHKKNITYEKFDIYDLPNHKYYGNFDSIVCMRVIPHLKDIPRALEILKHAIKDDGNVIFDLWNTQSYIYLKRIIARFKPNVYTDFKPYHEINALIKSSGLRIIRCKGWGYPKIPTYLLDKLGWKILPRFAYSILFNCVK